MPADAFAANGGQWPAEVCFARRVAGGQVWLEALALTIQLPVPGTSEAARTLAIRLRLSHHGAVAPAGAGTAGARHAYFTGPEASVGPVPSYDSVVYAGVHPGVDVRVRVHAGRLEYDVELAAGASLAGWQIDVEGADTLAIAADGALLMHTPGGTVRQAPAHTYQTTDAGQRNAVPCCYELRGPHSFGFRVDRVDVALPTTIDPGLDWSTFLGGSSYEFAYASAPAPSGGTVVVGETASTNFPVTSGAYDTSYNGMGAPSADVFVTRLDAAGQLVYSTYLGGSDGDKPYGVAVTAGGEAIVVGNTLSSDFPTTAGAWSRTMSGRSDGFVARLSASGAALLASTFLGGNDGEVVQAVALDSQGRAVVAGVTSSSDYPVTAGAWNAAGGGTSDAFATCVSIAADSLVWSSVFGGRSGDVAQAVAANDSTFVAGVTSSADFPTTAGSFQRVANGTSDGFVVKLSPGGTAATWSTLLGGGNGDVIEAVCVAAGDRPVVGGVTSSNDFPTTPGAFSRVVRGSSDTFVTKFAQDGSRLAFSTVLGGGSGDVGKDIALDLTGAVVVGGQTSSSDFPVTPRAYQGQARGSADGFLARVSPDGSALLEATYLGGGGSDGGEGASIDAARTATLVGVTNSSDYPVTAGAVRGSLSGTNDAFVARLPLTECLDVAYGSSTPSCRGPLALGLGRCAYAGDAAFAVVASNAPEFAPGVLLLGGAPLPGVPIVGITLWVDPSPPAITLPLSSDQDGTARLRLPLTGVGPGPRLFTQAVFVNPAACTGFPLLSATRGLEFRIQ